MNRISNFPGKAHLLIVFLSGLVLIGCGQGSGKKASASGDFEAGSLDAETQEQLNTAKRVFYSLPSPLETAMLIKNAGAEYDEELMNPTSNSSQYITTKSKALNLGIYSTDLSYASLFDQEQATLDYIEAAKAMADGLSIMDAIDEETVRELEEQINNRDAIIDIISETIMNSSSYLKENDMEGTASVVLVGGWVEGLFIACNLVDAKANLKEDKLVERIVDQKLSLDIMVALLQQSPEDPDAQEVLKDVLEIKEVFDKITINQGEVTAVENEETQVTTLESESSIHINSRVFTELKEKITKIRTSYIS